ncbi:hypothetical protein FRC01_001892 [Tulasnella sp. 417]|nr:hypothetical protein FRC01_001892 [Tulasnella sp. 417]
MLDSSVSLGTFIKTGRSVQIKKRRTAVWNVPEQEVTLGYNWELGPVPPPRRHRPAHQEAAVQRLRRPTSDGDDGVLWSSPANPTDWRPAWMGKEEAWFVRMLSESSLSQDLTDVVREAPGRLKPFRFSSSTSTAAMGSVSLP